MPDPASFRLLPFLASGMVVGVAGDHAVVHFLASAPQITQQGVEQEPQVAFTVGLTAKTASQLVESLTEAMKEMGGEEA